MIDYAKFSLPKSNSRSYEVSRNNLAAYAMLAGLDIPEFSPYQEGVTVCARSAKSALSSVLRSYGVDGARLDEVVGAIESAGMETFVEDLGPNPPQRKKMIRYVSNFLGAIKCGASDGEEYRETCREISERKKRYFKDRYDELVTEYFRTVDAVRKHAGSSAMQDGILSCD